MKKFVVSMLALCMAFSLCACNMRENNETTPNTTAPTTEPTEKPATDPVTDEPTKLPLETNTPDPDVDDDHLIDPTDGGKNDLLPDMEGRIFLFPPHIGAATYKIVKYRLRFFFIRSAA